MTEFKTYPEGTPFTGSIGRTASSSEPAWPVAPKPRAGDPNSLTPVEVEIITHDGARHRAALATVLGNPTKPLTPEAHLAKLQGNAAAALRPLNPLAVQRLIAMIDRLETLPDVTELAEVLA